MATVGSPLAWAGFLAVVAALLALDLGLLNRRAHAPRLREALGWTALWIAASLLFNGWVALEYGKQAGLEFLAGYVIEKALSVDNLFVFLVLFRSLAVPREHQHRVLFWGILGALVTRGAFIFAGTALISRFHAVLYLFGAFLVVTGARLLRRAEIEPHPERNLVARLFMRLFPMTPDYRGGAFLVREGGRRMATPLLLALVAAEATDVVFATDSIPAIFGVTRDPFLVFTSNIFAILGLRALYFVLADAMDRFHHLKTGLALVLVFIGAKMLAEPWYELSVGSSLAIICALLAAAIAASLFLPPPARPAPDDASPDEAGPPDGAAPDGGTPRRGTPS